MPCGSGPDEHGCVDYIEAVDLYSMFTYPIYYIVMRMLLKDVSKDVCGNRKILSKALSRMKGTC